MAIPRFEMPAGGVSAALSESFAAHLRVLDERLARGLESAGLDGAVVFSGAVQTVHRDDLSYPFRPEPYFKAWVPLTEHPDCVLKLEPGRRPLLLIAASRDYWHAPAPRPQGFWTDHFDIREVAAPADAIAALGPLERYAGLGQYAEGLFDAVKSERLLRYLDFHRAFKTPYEISCLEEASAIAAEGHLAVRRALEDAVSEFDLHQTFCAATGRRETQLPYGAIVALDEHAAILHYQNTRRRRSRDWRSLLLDAGVEVRGYASDITRTHGSVPEFLDLIEAVEGMQQSLCDRARVGVDFVELNETAHRLLAAILADHGLLKTSAESAHEQGITRSFLPHGLGHLLGLQVHDAGGRQTAPDGTLRAPPATHPHLRLTRVLERGFVVTIEPGLYFIPVLLEALRSSRAARMIRWEVVERLSPCGGIRIEDDVLVESAGVRNLTRLAFARADGLTAAAE
jgi:Xaa-Pro dipeptidase